MPGWLNARISVAVVAGLLAAAAVPHARSAQDRPEDPRGIDNFLTENTLVYADEEVWVRRTTDTTQS